MDTGAMTERFWRWVALFATMRLVEIHRRDELRAWIAEAEKRNAELRAQVARERASVERFSAHLRDLLTDTEEPRR